MTNKRLRKKWHRRFLDSYFADLCLVAPWRDQLLRGRFGEPYVLDAQHLAGVHRDAANAIRARGLRFEITKVPAHEAEPWLSEGGMLIFRYRAAEFPSVVAYSGNNPDIL